MNKGWIRSTAKSKVRFILANPHLIIQQLGSTVSQRATTVTDLQLIQSILKHVLFNSLPNLKQRDAIISQPRPYLQQTCRLVAGRAQREMPVSLHAPYHDPVTGTPLNPDMISVITYSYI